MIRFFEILSNVVIAATCRSKMEYKKVIRKMLDKNIPLETFENIIEFPKVPDYVAREIADKVGISWDTVKFDKNIGSIFMHFREMERRFYECNDIEKTILRTIKTLYDCGICEENLFPLDWIKIAAKKDELEVKDYEWTGLLENLEGKEFITLEENGVQAEEVYLEVVVKLPVEIKNLDVFKMIVTIFSGVPGALFKLGNRVYNLGTISLEKMEYMKIAITAYEEALKVYTLDRFPMEYVMTQSNLGEAYRTLAEVKDRIKNCKKAIEAFKKILKIRTLDDFPIQYANTQKSLGAAYWMLAEVRDKSENCKKAINACEETLKVFSAYDSPMDRAYAGTHMDYAGTQVILGNAYITLAEVKDRSENCKKAIEAYEKALSAKYPGTIDYAMIQNNLGTVYSKLAKVDDKTKNYNNAINAYKEALEVRTDMCSNLDDFPIQYAITHSNLGEAYWVLAYVMDRIKSLSQ